MLVCSFSFLFSSIFSVASLGFYLFSPNHSDPVSILIFLLRIQPYCAVIVYSMWDQTLAAPGTVTLLYPLWGGRLWKKLPPRQMSQREHSQSCSLSLVPSFSQKSHLPLSPGEEVSEQSSATSTAVVRVQQPLVPAAAQPVSAWEKVLMKMCFWLNPSHTISQGTLKVLKHFSLGKASGNCGSAWIQRGGGTGCFFEQNVHVSSCLHFVMGFFFFQYFNTLENSLVNLFVLLTTSK